MDRHASNLVVHGHAHHGQLEGQNYDWNSRAQCCTEPVAGAKSAAHLPDIRRIAISRRGAEKALTNKRFATKLFRTRRRGQESSPKAQLLLDRRVCWKNLHHLTQHSVRYDSATILRVLYFPRNLLVTGLRHKPQLIA